MACFYAAQQLTIPPSAEHPAARLAGPEALRGRDRLKQALHNFGFELL